MNKISNYKVLKEVWIQIEDKRKIIFFLFLSLFNGFIDAINIGILIPFLKVIEDPKILNKYYFFKYIIENLNYQADPRSFILVFFICIMLLSFLFRVYINWITLKISYTISENLASKIFEEALNRDYLDHISQSTSKSISDITFRVNATTTVLMSFIIIFNNLILSLMILSTLLFVNFKVIGIVISLIGLIYILLNQILKKRYNNNSVLISENQTSMIKTLQESLGGFKEIIFTSTQSIFVKEFNKNYSKLNNSLLFNNFFAQSPKIFIETFSILVLLGFFYYSYLNGNNLIEITGLIGVIAFGAQKLLPSFQAIYQNWSNVSSNKQLVLEILKALKQKKDRVESKKLIEFKEEISLNVTSFKYGEDKLFDNLYLKIKKGDKIGIIGESGAGKSTLINLITSLINQENAILKVDGIKINKLNIDSWRNQIAYVPQNIFLFDDSLKLNITFGIKSDLNLQEILRKVKLDSFINGRNIEEIYLGERSSQISGGEKQRIALARAIYKDISLMVIDEATNALDKNTEREIFDIIYSFDHITLIVISHDLENLYGCNKIFELKNKKLNKIEFH